MHRTSRLTGSSQSSASPELCHQGAASRLRVSEATPPQQKHTPAIKQEHFSIRWSRGRIHPVPCRQRPPVRSLCLTSGSTRRVPQSAFSREFNPARGTRGLTLVLGQLRSFVNRIQCSAEGGSDCVWVSLCLLVVMECRSVVTFPAFVGFVSLTLSRSAVVSPRAFLTRLCVGCFLT